MLNKVILCPNPYRDKDLSFVREAKSVLDEIHCPNVVCLPFQKEGQDKWKDLDIQPLYPQLQDTDAVIAFGGDGTMLHLSKTLTHSRVPMLGVNLGSLGFLADLEQSELHKLADFARGNYRIEERMMLDVEVVRDGRTIFTDLALNEALVARGILSRVIRLQILTEEGVLFHTRGDGIIVATPTGSTAYSMSAGGPIVEPTALSFVVNTICAHELHANSYVLSSDHTISVQTEVGGYKPVILSVDGGKAFQLHSGDRINIRKSEKKTRLIRMSNRSFGEILHKKMLGSGDYEE